MLRCSLLVAISALLAPQLVSCASDSGDAASTGDGADDAAEDETAEQDDAEGAEQDDAAQVDSGAGESDDAQGTSDEAPAEETREDAGNPTESEPMDTDEEADYDFGTCETPVVVESCYLENTDRPGTGVCSEYYAAGQAALFCEEQDIVTEPCPRGADLYGVCVGGVSSYFYADAANRDLWLAAGSGCTVNMGTWCGP